MILKTAVSVKLGLLFSRGVAHEGCPHPLLHWHKESDDTDELVHSDVFNTRIASIYPKLCLKIKNETNTLAFPSHQGIEF